MKSDLNMLFETNMVMHDIKLTSHKTEFLMSHWEKSRPYFAALARSTKQRSLAPGSLVALTQSRAISARLNNLVPAAHQLYTFNVSQYSPSFAPDVQKL
jgi:hypothetical protein